MFLSLLISFGGAETLLIYRVFRPLSKVGNSQPHAQLDLFYHSLHRSGIDGNAKPFPSLRAGLHSDLKAALNAPDTRMADSTAAMIALKNVLYPQASLYN